MKVVKLLVAIFRRMLLKMRGGNIKKIRISLRVPVTK